MMDVHMTNPARPKARKPAVVQHGVAHGTPAFRQIHSLAMGGTSSTGTRKRRSTGKKKAAAAPATRTRKAKSPRRATAARSGKAQLVKGSAAARKYMASLRAMRGKKAKAA